MFTDLPPIRIAGIAIGCQIIWIIGISLLLIGLLAIFFQKTRVGRAMRACAINREAAALQGNSGLAHAGTVLCAQCGHWRHRVPGRITLGLAQALTAFALGSGLKNVAALSVLLIFLFLGPSGILGEAK